MVLGFRRLRRGVIPDEPAHILELRIHGVLNTPPHAMLGVSRHEVEFVRGDRLGSFWTVGAQAGSRPDDAAGSKVPPGVRREAYSWGNLARNAPIPGGALLGIVGRALTEVGWLLVLPFGLCNLAYWSRRLPPQVQHEKGWRAGNGAASTRLFALVLTLLLVCTVATVSLDLVGVQCFPGGGQICARLPGLADVLAGMSRGQRLAVLAIVPVLAVLALFFVSHSGGSGFEGNVAAPGTQHADERRDGTHGSTPEQRDQAGFNAVPVLARHGFWDHDLVLRTTEQLHIAASLSLVVIAVAWDNVFAGQGNCPDFASVLVSCPGRAMPHIIGHPGGVATLVAGAALLFVVGWRVLVTSEASVDVPSRQGHITNRWSERLLICSVVLFVVVEIISWFAVDVGSKTGFVGLGATPEMLLAAAIALCVAALGWRKGASTGWSLAFFSLPAVVLLMGDFSQMGILPLPAGVLWVLLALALAVVVARVVNLIWGRSHRSQPQYEAWHGLGPGVIMLLAIGSSAAISCLLVAGVGAYLKQSTPQPDPDSIWRTLTPATGQGPSATITVPETYASLSGVVLLMLLPVALIMLAMLAWHLGRGPYLLTTPTPNRHAGLLKHIELPAYQAPRDSRRKEPAARQAKGHLEPVEDHVLRARRFAALAHRPERLLGILAASIALIGAAFVIFDAGTLPLWDPTSTGMPWLDEGVQRLKGTAVVALGAGALLIAAMVLVGGLRRRTLDRPAPLLWDLMCFLPRAAHTFGPPCYAQRVIPEVNARIREWLGSVDAVHRRRRIVVVSAHSLGGVLAAASLFSLWAEPQSRNVLGRVGLLSYGIQLRAYFGRFFPELLGPGVIGGEPCRGPSLFGADPWFKQVLADQNDERNVIDPLPERLTLTALLTAADPAPRKHAPRWLNLWRRTDYLGFPAYSYAASAVDRGADELERSTYQLQVATHSNYPDSSEYQGAFNEMVRNRKWQYRARRTAT